MLDDVQVLRQRDPHGALEVAASQWRQAEFEPTIDRPEHDGRQITKLVVTGMGGSALAALVAKTWLANEMTLPFEVVRGYDLPNYVDKNTLVIASSYSGNTEESLSALDQAIRAGAQTVVLAAGGQLLERGARADMCSVSLPAGLQPRMTVIYGLKALIKIFAHFDLVSVDKLNEITQLSEWLQLESQAWLASAATDKNYAKQLALHGAGKTAIIYGGALTAPLAYKWKISWNENAKNTAFWNEYPEFNHNEFMGWTSHPVEKPFAVFDLLSNLEHSQIIKRFEVSDRLLSGRRPKATVVELQGDSLIKQLLWGCILADFVSIYLAIINGVDPTPVDLIEKLKKELS